MRCRLQHNCSKKGARRVAPTLPGPPLGVGQSGGWGFGLPVAGGWAAHGNPGFHRTRGNAHKGHKGYASGSTASVCPTALAGL
jgi:hypothetical protein